LSVKVYADWWKLTFSIVLVTFHVSEGVFGSEYYKFVEYYRKISQESEKTGVRNLWIVKLGENTNRESGISIRTLLKQVRIEVSSLSICRNRQKRTFVLQKLIETPTNEN